MRLQVHNFSEYCGEKEDQKLVMLSHNHAYQRQTLVVRAICASKAQTLNATQLQ